MPCFRVELSRTINQAATLFVEASDEAAAQAQAIEASLRNEMTWCYVGHVEDTAIDSVTPAFMQFADDTQS